MKKITKIASIALAAVMLFSAVPMTASAASAKTVDSANVKKGIKLSWKKTAKAKKYTVYRSTKKNKGFKSVGTTNKVTFTDKKAKAGKTYYYKVKASTGSTYKVEKAVRLTAPKLKSVKVKKATNAVVVKWSAVKGAKKYHIYRAKVVNGKTKTFKFYDVSKKTQYKDWMYEAGTFKYKVAAVNGDSKGVTSNVKSINYVPSTAPLTTPNDEHTLMQVYFSPIDGVDGYKIYRSVNGSDYEQVYNVKAKNLVMAEGMYEGMAVYEDAQVEYGSTYNYAVQTYKGKNTSILAEGVETEFTEGDVVVEIGYTSNTLVEAIDTAKGLIEDIFGEELMSMIDLSFTFTVDSPEIATISKDYIVTGVSVGKTYAYMTMTMTFAGETTTETSEEPILIAVKEADVMLEVGQTSDYLIQATDSELADNVTVTYEIEDTSIATVSEDGTITAITPGKTNAYYTVITTEENGETTTEKSDPISVYVSEPVTAEPEEPTDAPETTPSESVDPSESVTVPPEPTTNPSESATVPTETTTDSSETVTIA